MNKPFPFKYGFVFISFIFLFFIALAKASPNKYGVLAAESSSDKENFCIKYFPEFTELPEQKTEARFHVLQDARELDWCITQSTTFKSSILLLIQGNCSIASQARNVQTQGGEGVLFMIPGGKVDQIDVNGTAAETINITVALISENSVQRLKMMNTTVSVCLFAPYSLNFDFSLLIIWFIAMFTLIIGSYWSGHIRFTIYCRELSQLPGANRELPNKPSVKASTAEDSSLNVSPYLVGMFVLCMGAMLLLLYFFFDYLVYFIIGLFVLASIISLYSCFKPLIMRIPAKFCKPSKFRCFGMICNIDFRHVILIALSFAAPICWVVYRKEKYSWILQDVLGVAFCIHMLKSIRLPNLKICTILLVLLFFYDIFFVFVTPFLTVKGESVMEEVATGGKSNEMLPMVLRVAHFGFDPLSVCYSQFSLLGFGDILVPGLLISYCHGFDLMTNKKRVYFVVTVFTYGFGLLITFVGLFLMSTAQPALLYLVPSTLIPPVLIGWYRKELPLLWNGFKVIKPSEAEGSANAPSESITDRAPQAEHTTSESDPLPTVSNSISHDSINPAENIIEATGERKHLLH